MFQYEYNTDNNIINENSISNIKPCSCGLGFKYNEKNKEINKLNEQIIQLRADYAILKKKYVNLEHTNSILKDRISYDIIEPLYKT